MYPWEGLGDPRGGGPGQYFENHSSKLISSLRSHRFWALVYLQHSLDFMHTQPSLGNVKVGRRWLGSLHPSFTTRKGHPLSLALILGSWREVAMVQWVAQVLQAVQGTREVRCVLDQASWEFASSAWWWAYDLNESPPFIFKGKKRKRYKCL